MGKKDAEPEPEGARPTAVDGVSDREVSREFLSTTRQYQFSARDNSHYKWQKQKGVLGALEIPSEPELDVREAYVDHAVPEKKDDFEEALGVWESLELREEFISAVESVPPQTTCCGLVADNDETIKEVAKALKKGWVKDVNVRLKEHGFKLNVFLWTWSNPVGKADTAILLLRFIELNENDSTRTE